MVSAKQERARRAPGCPPGVLVAGGAAPAMRVRCAVARAEVRLALHDTAGRGPRRRLVHEDLAQKRPRYPERRLEIEPTGQGAAAGHACLSFFTSSVSSGTALKRSATRP